MNKNQNIRIQQKIKKFVEKIKSKKNIFKWLLIFLWTVSSGCFIAFSLGAFNKKTILNTTKYTSINVFEKKLSKASMNTGDNIYFNKVIFDTYNKLLTVEYVDNFKKETLFVPMSTFAMNSYEVNNGINTRLLYGIIDTPYRFMRNAIKNESNNFEGDISHKIKENKNNKNNTLIIVLAFTSSLIPLLFIYKKLKTKKNE